VPPLPQGLPVEPTELLQFVAEVFERLNIPYAVVGSVASSFYGEARLTNDIDVVADLRNESVKLFLRAFPPGDFYLSEDAIREAIRTRTQFNIIHPDSGLKVDVIIPELSGIDQLGSRRRVRPKDAGFDAYFGSPEDVILKKLEFYLEGGSEKHLRDITGILKISGDQVDRDYITSWAQRLGVLDIWDKVRARADGGA
jgi:hypothetical protein